MRAKALLYHLGEESETGRALRAVLEEQNILTLSVGEEALGETAGRLASANGETVGRLASANGETADAGVPERVPEAAFMLLCALGDRQLDRLLAAMRRAGVFVPYKAVLTATNRDWTLGALIDEVVREHEMLNRQ